MIILFVLLKMTFGFYGCKDSIKNWENRTKISYVSVKINFLWERWDKGVSIAIDRQCCCQACRRIDGNDKHWCLFFDKDNLRGIVQMWCH